MEKRESLAAVHTHTHTHTLLSRNTSTCISATFDAYKNIRNANWKNRLTVFSFAFLFCAF